MSTATPEKLMTAEEFLALPEDDGVERMLICGRLWEKTMTRRNRWHSRTEARIAELLGRWLATQPEPRGEIYSGEAGFRLPGSPPTIVGIDVAYVSADVARSEPDDTALVDGAPVLAVEILSPNDKQEEIAAKIESYIKADVPLVWVVDPHFKTVVVHRPSHRPEMFHGDDELPADPHLPGFHVKAAEIFSR
jgi:Uma2 family endonuclease